MAHSNDAIIAKRRELVQVDTLRGMSTREIERRFAQVASNNWDEAVKLGLVNPKTNKVWDHATIARDIGFLEAQWQSETRRERIEHKSRQLAELREHRRVAWAENELAEVRLSIKSEMELLGTSEDIGTEDRPAIVKIVSGVDLGKLSGVSNSSSE